VKENSAFYFDRSKPNGSTTCRDCRKVYAEQHADEVRARAARRDPEQRRAYSRAYYWAHRKRTAARVKAARGPEWYARNRAKRDAADAKRRARMAVATERVDRLAVFARDGYECHICGGICTPRHPDRREWPTLDHLVPLSLGGHHLMENVATAHYSCNTGRGNRVQLGEV